MNGSIMQLYRFLCAVIVLAVSVRAEQNGTCLVPATPNGHIQRQRFVYLRGSVQNMTVGSSASNNVTWTLVCHEGQSDNGTRMPETKKIMCLNGKWKPDPSCPGKPCSVPLIKNGYIQEKYFNWITFEVSVRNVSLGSLRTDKDSMWLACDIGYHVQKTEALRAVIKCSNGQWSPNAACYRTTCSVPLIPNGNIQEGNVFNWTTNRWESYRNVSVGSLSFYNTTFLLVCHEDYSFKGDGASRIRIRCSEGQFSPEPVCLKTVFCPPVDMKDSFNVVYKYGRRVNCKAIFSCKDVNKKIPRGSDTWTCLPTGNWSGGIPECKETCSVPLIPNGNIQEGNVFNWTAYFWESYKNVSVGTLSSDNTTFLLVCDKDHSFKGAGASTVRITCLKGQFSPDPVCLKKTCSAPLVPNGNIQERVRFSWRRGGWTERNVSVGSLLSHDAALSLVCDEDHSLQGAGMSRVQITCSDGQWSPDPVCLKSIICPPIDEKDVFMVVYNNSRKINSTARFYCIDVSQEIVGDSDTWTCLPTGNWSGEIPECKGINGCHLDPKSLSPLLITDPPKRNFRFGEYVDLSCPFGMKLTSNVEMLMCMGSRWSDEVPGCQ